MTKPQRTRLTLRRTRFIAEYLIDLKPAAAAIRAGFSAKTAPEIAYELLRDPQIAEAIAVGKAEAAKRLELTADDIKRELKAIAFARITDYVSFDAKGVKFRPSKDLTPEQCAAIAEVRESDKHAVSFKLSNKIEALMGLAKLCGFIVDRHEHELSGNATAKIQFYMPDNGRRPLEAQGESADEPAQG